MTAETAGSNLDEVFGLTDEEAAEYRELMDEDSTGSSPRLSELIEKRYKAAEEAKARLEKWLELDTGDVSEDQEEMTRLLGKRNTIEAILASRDRSDEPEF